VNIVPLEPASALDAAVKSIGSSERTVICGPPHEATLLEERLAIARSTPDDIITASMTIDVEAWFREQREELESEWNEDLEENEGEWPGDDVPKQAFTGTTDIGTGKPLDQVIGVRLPLQASWQIPAHLQIGGWNDCPDPEVHCAIWRYWETKYGAAIISVSNDVVEAYVANPPATPEEALALAWQQYLYCYDIVDQGTETIANLAAGLMNHHYWFFWWD
jgi:hypothetical protein